ncbi:MAG: hypothetical protein ABW166_12530 [Sedimenticola sp.]
MKKQSKMLLLGILASTSVSLSAQADSSFNARFSDATWDGKQVPTGQQCQKFGGEPSTPALSVSGIPAGANLLVMEYSDKTYKKMDDGGHGKIGYALNGEGDSAQIPSIPGHSFDLPSGFFLVAAHRAPKWDKAGAYMPPCSGGKGNDYHLTVKAIKQDGERSEILAQTLIVLGKY